MEETLKPLTTCENIANTKKFLHLTIILLFRCYMPNHWVALVSTALPIVLCTMCMVLLFSHACIYWGQWEQYDDMYYFSHNYRGIQNLHRHTVVTCNS